MENFHSTKSAGWRLLLGAEHLALTTAGAHVVERLVGEQSVVVDRLDRQVDAVVGDVGVVATSISSPIISTISPTYSVACGTSVGRSTLMPAIASNHTLLALRR